MIKTESVKRVYGLEERTSLFAEKIIDFAKTLDKNEVSRPLISQFVKSGTSIGANYMEATAGESKKDFIHKIGIARKESKESAYWMRMIMRLFPLRQKECQELHSEAKEFVLIFSAIIKNSRKSGAS